MREKVLTPEEVEQLRKRVALRRWTKASSEAQQNADALRSAGAGASSTGADRRRSARGRRWIARCSERVIEAMTTFPEDFHLHPKLRGFVEKRRRFSKAARSTGRSAEALAFGTLVLEGTPVRLSGSGLRARHVQPAASGILRLRERASDTSRCSTVAAIRRGSTCATAR